MLLSMTGFGEAHAQSEGLTIGVEMRTVNSRHFKLSYRCSEGYSSLESNVEALIRKQVRRGTVQVNLRVDHEASVDYRVNSDVIEKYRWQLDALKGRTGTSDPITLSDILMLPGVIDEKGLVDRNPQEDWPHIQPVIQEALDALTKMRSEEGQALVEDLESQWRTHLWFAEKDY